MVIIVPSFSKSEEGDPKIISTFVVGFVSSASKKMGKRINRKGSVIKKNGGNQKSPNKRSCTIQTRVVLKPGKGTQCVAGKGKEEDRDPVEAIEKAKFRKFKQILNFFEEGGDRILCHKPKRVTPKQTSCLWGMNIIFSIGMTMMPAVMGSPPQWSTLTRTAGYERTDKLNGSGCLEGPVRKISVVESGDAKHSNGVGKQCKQSLGTQRNPGGGT